MQNHNEIAEFLWKIADHLRGDYDAKDFEDVILPFTLLRRLDCVLEPTRNAVREAAKRYKDTPEKTRDALLKKAAEQSFYNTSEYSLIELLKYPNDLGANFEAYLSGFSANVKDILYNFSGGEEKGLGPIYETLLRKRLLFKVTQAFADAPLDLKTVDNHGMGTIYEYLIRKFKEATNEAAGEHFTPRDVIRLMVKLIFEPDRDKLAKEKLIAIYDPACGTGGMLTSAKEYLLAGVNESLEVYLYGQELNEKTYAICKADMLMKGEDPENIKRENTLSHDLLPGKQFNYMLSNPPFGDDWKKIREEVENEHAMGANGRYAPGLPSVDDSAMLFLLHKLNKMHPSGSKIALIFNGSPLFNGDAGSGPSNIRKYILENDWLDAIVALPNDLFYNTAIATYIWIINNRKPQERRGKIQLINATSSDYFKPLRKSLGKKRVEVCEDQANGILHAYENFEESKISKIFDKDDFGYTKVTVQRPLRLRYDLTDKERGAFKASTSFEKLNADRAKALSEALDDLAMNSPWMDDKGFRIALTKKIPFKLTQSLIKVIQNSFGIRDDKAEIVKDEIGKIQPDSELRDYENIPFKIDIEKYFNQKVLPYFPDAWMDRTKDKIGYSISFPAYFFEYASLISAKQIELKQQETDKEIESLLRQIKQSAQKYDTVHKGLDINIPMKDSGVPWLDQIPAHWDIKPFFSVMKELSIKNTGGSIKNVLSLSYGKIIRRDVSENLGLLPESFDTYQIIQPDNIVLRLLDLQNDHVSLRTGLVCEEGIITSAYTAVQPNDELIPAYANYLLHVYDLLKVFYAFGGGCRQSMTFDDLKHLPLLIPSKDEQKAIVEFIDREKSKYDLLKSLFNKKIALLSEYEASLAKEAVTGL